ncbi:MAG: hypothetical protein EAZ91_07630 [Cytophagales bacterium]|nr:MAG: hypothetical protein EAZ91_07630 [Cytophagales bacterium]
MKALVKSAFFFMAMISLATSCQKKAETTETTTVTDSTAMTTDSAATMATDTMATDSAAVAPMAADSAK